METVDFGYLAEKITAAPFSDDPFRHVYIDDFLSQEHFNQILSCSEIAAPPASNDKELFSLLRGQGYKPIPFPGCITDEDAYIRWHRGEEQIDPHSSTEGFGVVLRLEDIRSPILVALRDYLDSEAFNRAVAQKFDVDFDKCTFDGGIQKYLDGYEISPHPDIRRKATTFMVNINPNDHSESANHHTHYMTFKPERAYVQSFWQGNPKTDRCWVPWDWCETSFQQTKNNSVVLFSPDNDTVHAVRARYDHLMTQRTQLYGNLWYEVSPAENKLEWEQLDLGGHAISKKPARRIGRAKKQSTWSLSPKKLLKAIGGRSDNSDVGKRRI